MRTHSEAMNTPDLCAILGSHINPRFLPAMALLGQHGNEAAAATVRTNKKMAALPKPSTRFQKYYTKK